MVYSCYLIVLSISITLLPLDFILERINNEPDFIENILKNPITGKGTSREIGFTLGLQRLSDEPWIIGYGWAVGSGNKMAWFGGSLTGWARQRADPHSLYYAIIPIFGWIGAVAFILLILNLIFSLYKTTKKIKIKDSLLFPLSIGLFFLLTIFYRRV